MRVARTIIRGAVIAGTAWAAGSAFRKALGIGNPWTTPHDPDVARSLNNYAVGLLRQGLDESAEPLFYTAHELLESADPARFECLWKVRANLAALRTARAAREREAGKDDAARPLLTEAIEVLEVSGPQSARMLGRALTNLARLEQSAGDTARAIHLLDRARHTREAARLTDADAAAENLMALADVHEALGHRDESDACLEHAATLLRNTTGRARARLGTCLSRRASLAHARGRLVEAGALYRHALQIKVEALGRRHPSVARTLEDHAALLHDLDRPALASLLEARARPIREHFPRRDPLRRVELLDTSLIPLGG